MPKIELIQGDCLEKMKDIPDGSIDMILCDLPYGITQNKWDSVINLPLLWQEYNRILKNTGACVLFCAQPFTSVLIASNINNSFISHRARIAHGSRTKSCLFPDQNFNIRRVLY